MTGTETIGGTALSTYGLRLSKIEGNFDLPSFKRILNEHDYEANLLVLNEKLVTIKLIGKYATKAALGTALSNFYTKVRSAVKLNWIFGNYLFDETCVVKDGIVCNIYDKTVELTLILRVTE